MGCAQCHGTTFNGPAEQQGRGLANLVYNHTTAMPQHRALLGQNATNLDMGNYSRARLSAGDLAIDLFLGAR
jgi:hypothetical protein